jgi:hypothetical protein
MRKLGGKHGHVVSLKLCKDSAPNVADSSKHQGRWETELSIGLSNVDLISDLDSDCEIVWLKV